MSAPRLFRIAPLIAATWACSSASEKTPTPWPPVLPALAVDAGPLIRDDAAAPEARASLRSVIDDAGVTTREKLELRFILIEPSSKQLQQRSQLVSEVKRRLIALRSCYQQSRLVVPVERMRGKLLIQHTDEAAQLVNVSEVAPELAPCLDSAVKRFHLPREGSGSRVVLQVNADLWKQTFAPGQPIPE